MDAYHQHVLTDIEHRAQSRALDLAHVDELIAEELDVPVDYYFAYLLVRHALDAYDHHQTSHRTARSYGSTDSPSLTLIVLIRQVRLKSIGAETTASDTTRRQ